MSNYTAPSRSSALHKRGAEKLARIPVRVDTSGVLQPKPAWIRTRVVTNERVLRMKRLLREHQLHSVCEEASCPNLGECFSRGTATFMIMGDICTRRCPFCDVAHGRPQPLDEAEPMHLARAIESLALNYVVLTSVDRDDLLDGGSAHFASCIELIRTHCPKTCIEILVPDFRGRMQPALEALSAAVPDVFNHNLETVPRLYRSVRPGADYRHSLELLQQFGARFADIPTKSGLMLGLGETLDEVHATMQDLRAHGVSMLTLGQYLQPSRDHLAVVRYIEPQEFDALSVAGKEMGFRQVASGPMVRSSYHADLQFADFV